MCGKCEMCGAWLEQSRQCVLHPARSAAQMRALCPQPGAAPLEGLARSGSQACLTALRECLPARPARLRSPPSPALAQPTPLAPAPGHAAAHQRPAVLLQPARRTSCAQGAGCPMRCQGPVAAPAGAEPEGMQPEWGKPARATCSCCLRGSGAGVVDAAQGPAPPTTGPTERPQRPAWLEEAARRISQGITLGGCAAREGPSAPRVPFPEALPAAFAVLGVAQRSAA